MDMNKSFVLKKESHKPKWHVIDASDKVLGRLATQVADILRGKNRPEYTPHTDSGDYVIVTNCDKIRLTGDNPRAAEYAGISIKKNIVLVMMLSGALAGLAGMSEISGVVHRLQGAISPGYGFTGIIIAWLAKLNPLAVIVVSILFGALILAGREVQPAGIPTLIQGVIMVSLIASDFFLRNRVTIVRRMEE